MSSSSNRDKGRSPDPEGWDPVFLPTDDSARSKLFRRRVKAMRSMLCDGDSVRSAAKRFEFRQRELFRLRQRCLTPREDGRPFGYQALFPGARIQPYTRRTANAKGGGGQLSQLFAQYPAVQKAAIDAFLGRKRKGRARERIMRHVGVWRVFLEACKEAGLKDTDYPFTTRDQGRESLRRYCKRLHQHGLFRRYVHARSGEAAAKVADAGCGEQRAIRALVPYQWAQLDGHRIDTIATVEVLDWLGLGIDLPLERCWLLVVMDIASRAILGYSISLLRNYSSEDVQDAIAHALSPWERKAMMRTRVPYLQGAGFPSGAIPGCAWRAFDRISFDNAFSQQSFATQQQIINTTFGTTNTNPPETPLSNAAVERVFGSIENWCFQRLPSTVGSGPKDARKHKPDKAAERFQIRFSDLEELIDVTLANYNAQPHKSLDGRSPLQFIRQSMSRRSTLVRHILPPHQLRLPIHDRAFERVVRGSVKKGIRPYVEFLGVRYRSQSLSVSTERIGEKVKIVVNTKDIRNVRAFDLNGVFVGELCAPDIWMGRPHSIRTRRAILAHMRKATLTRDSVNPIDDYFRLLDSRLRENAKTRNERVRVERESAIGTQMPTSSSDMPASSPRTALHQRSWVSIDKTLN